MSTRAPALLAAVAQIALGCGGGTAAAGARAEMGGGGVRQWSPSGGRAARYETSSEPWQPAGAVATVLAAMATLGPSLTPDRALARVAAAAMDTVDDAGAAPPAAVIEFLTRWHGLVEPQPALFVAQAGDADELAAGLAQMVAEGISRVPYNRVGVATREVPGGIQAVVLLSMRWVEIEPTPVHLEPDASFVLRGRLLGTFRSPRVVVTDARDRTRELPAEGTSSFAAELPTDVEGTVNVEVLGESERGVMVLANFPVWIGTEPPDSLELDSRESAGATAEAVGDDLFRLVNQARRARGLGPLERTGPLDDVALAHSREMHDGGFVGHTSPTTGSPSDRLRRASIRSALVLENIGRGYSGREIHDGLMLSPGHRGNLLHPAATHIGIGVLEEREGERSAFLATQVFIQVPRAIDARTAGRDLVRKVNQRRQQRGAAAVELDDGLSRLARDAVERFFRERVSQEEAVGQLNRSLERYGLAYRRVAVLFAATASIDDTAAMEPLLEPDVRVLGIGIAQGEHPEIGHPAVVTIVVMAWPR